MMSGPCPQVFWGAQNSPRENGNGQTIIASSPVTVPAYFAGLDVELATWPIPSEATYGMARSWDYRGPTVGAEYVPLAMNFINPAAGVYHWGAFDEFVAANAGRKLLITLGNPANYLVSRAAVGGVTPWLQTTKANMCPDDLVGWATAVTAVVNRLKDAGKTGCVYELWNEFDLSGYYNDSIALIGPYVKATVEAIKAVDSTAVILSPSIVALTGTTYGVLTQFYNASDGAGGYSKTWIDGGSAFHFYGLDGPTYYKAHFDAVNAAAVAAGVNLPLWQTESGLSSVATGSARRLAERMVTFAALGAKCYVAFSWKSPYGLDVSVAASTWNKWAGRLAGATISSMYLDKYYQPYVVINGTTYKVEA